MLLVSATSAMAQGAKNIRLNEVLTNNTASIVDEFGNREAWIEVENTSFTTYNIRGMYFTTDPQRRPSYSDWRATAPCVLL